MNAESFRIYKIRKWRYLNGTYIGITQIIDYFSTTQICEFERDAKTVLRYAESTKFWLPKSAEESAAMPFLVYLRTLDKNERARRLKMLSAQGEALTQMIRAPGRATHPLVR